MRIACFLVSKRNDWFNFSNNFLFLNDLSFERFLKTFRRVIEKTLFKLNENRIFVRVISVCTFEAMLLFSFMMINSFYAFLLLSTISELKRNWHIFFVYRITNLILRFSYDFSLTVSSYTTHKLESFVSNI